MNREQREMIQEEGPSLGDIIGESQIGPGFFQET